MVKLGSYDGKVRLLIVSGDSESESAAEETMLLWGIQQPTLSKPNAFVAQSSLNLRIDACGHSLSILQSPSSLVIFNSPFLWFYILIFSWYPVFFLIFFYNGYFSDWGAVAFMLQLLYYGSTIYVSISEAQQLQMYSMVWLQGKPGVTGSVMWDSGVVLGKFLEHAVDSGMLLLHGKKIVELGSGCGLVG